MKIFKTLKASVKLLSILFITLVPTATYSQPKQKKLFTNIRIYIEDTTLVNNASLVFNMSKNDINTGFAAINDVFTFKVNNRVMLVKVPLSTYLNYGRLEIEDNRHTWERPLNWENNLFLFKDKEYLSMHLGTKRQGVYFTGVNADRFNCMYDISSHSEPVDNRMYNELFKRGNVTEAFSYRRSQYDSLLKVQLNILKKYSSNMSLLEADLISIDCHAGIYQQIIDMCYGQHVVGNKETYNAAKVTFNHALYNPPGAFIKNQTLLVKSYRYADFLYKREKTRVIIRKSTDSLSYYKQLSFSDLNDAINTNLAGALKDKVILLAFYHIDRMKQADFGDFIVDAPNKAGENRFKMALEDFKNSSAVGSPAYEFELVDIQGKTRRLSDYKGKVVIMDFWFTGCVGCRDLSKSMKPIVSSLRSDSSLVFVTVSIDRNKQVWKKSLSEELYSSNEEVNLLAENGRQSSIIEHYNIASYPSIVIIGKDSKILSVAPPDPRIDPVAFVSFIKRSGL